jgi:hypothetical protein
VRVCKRERKRERKMNWIYGEAKIYVSLIDYRLSPPVYSKEMSFDNFPFFSSIEAMQRIYESANRKKYVIWLIHEALRRLDHWDSLFFRSALLTHYSYFATTALVHSLTHTHAHVRRSNAHMPLFKFFRKNHVTYFHSVRELRVRERERVGATSTFWNYFSEIT